MLLRRIVGLFLDLADPRERRFGPGKTEVRVVYDLSRSKATVASKKPPKCSLLASFWEVFGDILVRKTDKKTVRTCYPKTELAK